MSQEMIVKLDDLSGRFAPVQSKTSYSAIPYCSSAFISGFDSMSLLGAMDIPLLRNVLRAIDTCFGY